MLDDFNREALAIEIDSSLPSARVVRVFEQPKTQRGLPDILHTDNGPEFLGAVFVEWFQQNGIFTGYYRAGRAQPKCLHRAF